MRARCRVALARRGTVRASAARPPHARPRACLPRAAPKRGGRRRSCDPCGRVLQLPPERLGDQGCPVLIVEGMGRQVGRGRRLTKTPHTKARRQRLSTIPEQLSTRVLRPLDQGRRRWVGKGVVTHVTRSRDNHVSRARNADNRRICHMCHLWRFSGVFGEAARRRAPSESGGRRISTSTPDPSLSAGATAATWATSLRSRAASSNAVSCIRCRDAREPPQRSWAPLGRMSVAGLDGRSGTVCRPRRDRPRRACREHRAEGPPVERDKVPSAGDCSNHGNASRWGQEQGEVGGVTERSH